MRLLIKTVRAPRALGIQYPQQSGSNSDRAEITTGDRLQKKEWRESFKLHFRTRTRHLNLISSEREEICECLSCPETSTFFQNHHIAVRQIFTLSVRRMDFFSHFCSTFGDTLNLESHVNQSAEFPRSRAVIRKFPASEMNIHSISPAERNKYECVAGLGI